MHLIDLQTDTDIQSELRNPILSTMVQNYYPKKPKWSLQHESPRIAQRYLDKYMLIKPNDHGDLQKTGGEIIRIKVINGLRLNLAQ